MDIKIYFSEDSPLVEEEMEMKEWRGDIIVEHNGKYYDFQFITLNRLNSDVNRIMKTEKYYEFDSSTIIVKKIRKSVIIDYLLELDEDDFKRLSTIDLAVFKNSFPELQDINNWVRIY